MMKLLPINIIPIILTFICVAVAAKDLEDASLLPEQVGISKDRLHYLDKVLEDYVDSRKLAGGVVIIARHNKVVYHKPFGLRDKEAGATMQKDTMFRIASQSKAIISVGVMMLQEQGKLTISDPVGKYLPEFKNTKVAEVDSIGNYTVVPAKRMITIRDLLTHTAGIGYGFGAAKKEWEKAGVQGWYCANRDEGIDNLVARIAQLPQDAQPGEKFIYGYNTDILGRVIEVVSGKSLDQFLTENIFDPLVMQDTYFYIPTSKENRLAVVYSPTEEGIERAPSPGDLVGWEHIGQGQYVNGPRKCFSGGAGLVSTAMDYARLLQMLLNGGELNGKRILSRKSVELMTADHLNYIISPQNAPDYMQNQGFGLGFLITNSLGGSGRLGSVGSYGWAGAYHSIYWVDPKEELIVVYLTQLIPSQNIDDFQKVNSLVYQAIVD